VSSDIASIKAFGEATLGAALDQEEWQDTRVRLSNAAGYIADGLTETCWEGTLSSILNRRSDNLTRAELTAAARRVRFENGLTTADVVVGTTIRPLFEEEPGRYATAVIDGSVVYWRPGATSEKRGSDPAWMYAAVLHELLHNLGFWDDDIQKALGLPLDPLDTENISRALATRCFGPA